MRRNAITHMITSSDSRPRGTRSSQNAFIGMLRAPTVFLVKLPNSIFHDDTAPITVPACARIASLFLPRAKVNAFKTHTHTHTHTHPWHVRSHTCQPVYTLQATQCASTHNGENRPPTLRGHRARDSLQPVTHPPRQLGKYNVWPLLRGRRPSWRTRVGGCSTSITQRWRSHCMPTERLQLVIQSQTNDNTK